MCSRARERKSILNVIVITDWSGAGDNSVIR